jgi:protein-tyrosine phosphatase
MQLLRQDSYLLFLCTGNYYRSRFAELLFNARAGPAGLSWVAESRGLALERGANNVGPISTSAIRELRARGITPPSAFRYPVQVQESAFEAADEIIALDETEHRPLLTQRFPRWVDRVEYWSVPDANLMPAADALALIDREIVQLIARLGQRVRT